MPRVVWAYGVATVPERFGELLPRTLRSLATAGFDRPHLFIDGPVQYDWPAHHQTTHSRPLRAFGNWVMALWELLVRYPTATHYVLFQDDIVCVLGLRQYLEGCPLPPLTYRNLITYPNNAGRKPADLDLGWYHSDQMGRGAQGLLFTRQGVVDLLSQRRMAEKPLDTQRGHKALDGAVALALKDARYTEQVHYPSLIDHTGTHSAIGNVPQPVIDTFPGEQFNVMAH